MGMNSAVKKISTAVLGKKGEGFPTAVLGKKGEGFPTAVLGKKGEGVPVFDTFLEMYHEVDRPRPCLITKSVSVETSRGLK